MFFFKKTKKTEPIPQAVNEPVPKQTNSKPVADKNEYNFIVKSENENTDKALQKYQKFYTDKDDIYDGMDLLTFKEIGDPGDKVYQCPPLKVSAKIEAFIAAEDGSVTISVYILEGDDEIYVGKAAKTKGKKILRTLQNNNPKITGELYGGKYWKIEDSGYVNADWSDDLTVRVFLTW